MTHLYIPGGSRPPAAPGGAQGPDALLEELFRCSESHPQLVSVVNARQLLLGSKRGGPERPGAVTLALDDDVVRALTGPAGKQRWKVVVAIIAQEAIDRLASPIILPGELAGGGR